MEQWEYLLQKEGDRSWRTLKTPNLEIEEGRYRVVAHSQRLNTDVEIHITHQATEEVPPKRRTQKRSRKTNSEGLILIVPFTYLKPGIWNFRCCNDILSNLVGDVWQKEISIEVLPSHSSANPIAVESDIAASLPKDETLSTVVEAHDGSNTTPIAVESNVTAPLPLSTNETLSTVETGDIWATAIEPELETAKDVVDFRSQLAVENTSLDSTKDGDKNTELNSEQTSQLAPVITSVVDLKQRSLQDIDEILEQLVDPVWEEFDKSVETAANRRQGSTLAPDENISSEQVDLKDKSNLLAKYRNKPPLIAPDEQVFRLTLDRDNFIGRRGESITLTGQVDIIDDLPLGNEYQSLNSVFKGYLVYELHNPQNSELLVYDELPLPEEVTPFSFSFSFEFPSDCQSSLILGEVTLCNYTPLSAIANQPFSINLDLQELLGAIQTNNSPNTNPVPALQKEAIAKPEPLPSPPVPLAEIEPESLKVKLDLFAPIEAAIQPQFQPAINQPLPPKIYQNSNTPKVQKSLELPKIPPKPVAVSLEEVAVAIVPAIDLSLLSLDEPTENSIAVDRSVDQIEATPLLQSQEEQAIAEPTTESFDEQEDGAIVSEINLPTTESFDEQEDGAIVSEINLPTTESFDEQEDGAIASEINLPTTESFEDETVDLLDQLLPLPQDLDTPETAVFDWQLINTDLNSDSENTLVDTEEQFYNSIVILEPNSSLSSSTSVNLVPSAVIGQHDSTENLYNSEAANLESVEEPLNYGQEFTTVDENQSVDPVVDNLFLSDRVFENPYNLETSNIEPVGETPDYDREFTTVDENQPVEVVVERVSPIDGAFQALRLEDRFWLRINSLATDTELSEALQESQKYRGSNIYQDLDQWVEPGSLNDEQNLDDDEWVEPGFLSDDPIQTDKQLSQSELFLQFDDFTDETIPESELDDYDETKDLPISNEELIDNLQSLIAEDLSMVDDLVSFEPVIEDEADETTLESSVTTEDEDFSDVPEDDTASLDMASSSLETDLEFPTPDSPIPIVLTDNGGEWVTTEIVVDDDLDSQTSPASLDVEDTESVSPTSISLPKFEYTPVPTPELMIPGGELTAGEPVTVWIKLPPHPSPVYIKLWIQDRQSRAMLDGPRSLMDFSTTDLGELETMVQLTVPFGSVEIRIEAIAIDISTQGESHKISVNRVVIPPDLPSLFIDKFED